MQGADEHRAVEIAVNVLDLLAFFLITPEIIGDRRRERVTAWAKTTLSWLRSGEWFKHKGPGGAFSDIIGTIATTAMLYVTLSISAKGFDATFFPEMGDPAGWGKVGNIASRVFFGLFSLVGLYHFTAYLTLLLSSFISRYKAGGAFLIVGAMCFLAARLVSISMAVRF